MTLLLLVRHGETDWNTSRRLQGDRDVPLGERGRAQVGALAPVVAEFGPEHVVCSPLSRTRETAALLGHHDPALDDRWKEADLGRWTGRSSLELREHSPQEYAGWRAGTFTPPEAEPFAAMVDRVVDALEVALDKGGTVLVVTHGGPVRAACRRLVGLQPANLLPVSPASLTAVDVQGRLAGQGSGRLRAYNVTGSRAAPDPPD